MNLYKKKLNEIAIDAITSEVVEHYSKSFLKIENNPSTDYLAVLHNEKDTLIKRDVFSKVSDFISYKPSEDLLEMYLPVHPQETTIKDKFIPKNNILGMIKLSGYSLKELKRILCESIRLSFNTIHNFNVESYTITENIFGEIFVDSHKIVGIDSLEYTFQGINTVLINFFILCNGLEEVDQDFIKKYTTHHKYSCLQKFTKGTFCIDSYVDTVFQILSNSLISKY